MKRQLSFMNNESGFFLPYTLFITAFIFIIVTANINIYKQEILLTDQHIDHLKIETLIQMAYVKFKEEYPVHELDIIETKYSLPYGLVKVTYRRVNEQHYTLHFHVTTENGSDFTILNTHEIPK